MTLPDWVPEVEDKPAPMPLLLVQAFVDTLDREPGTDELADPVAARAWLAKASLIPDGADLTAGDLELAREVRESIRALISHDPLTPGQLRPLDAVLAQAQPPLDITKDGQVRLCADPAGKLADGLVRLLLIIRDAQADGTWDRLKLCANPDCRWAFYDRSHSRRGQWCDMTTCGNKIKNRNLRARQRDSQTDQD
jgi:predicted RNA-binding Zn ribbon-like protein